MTKPIYIHGGGCISIQPTLQPDYFFDTFHSYASNPVPALEPDYKSLIPPLQLRRMNKSMRMALFTAKQALLQAGRENVDAVIVGSGLGCLRDSERFVEAILAEEGQPLNPTPFIQSTHNMAAATIALSLGCKGYNMTYVNNASSFESALLDTLVYLMEHPGRSVLVGGVDELGDRTTLFWELADYLKKDGSDAGETAAEGASFFVASAERGESALGKVTAVECCVQPHDVEDFIRGFLRRQGLGVDDLDAVLLGVNGDGRYDAVYESVARRCFPRLPQMVFKPILGEYDTVTAAGVFLALQVLARQSLPPTLLYNGIHPARLQRILVYTQRRGRNHGLILLEQ